MADYALTLDKLRGIARHRLGGNPDARAPLDDLINGAIQYLAGAHPWSWLTQITTLGFTASQAHINLPTDFAHLVDLQGYQSPWTACRRADPRIVISTRVRGAGLGNGTLVYFVGPTPQTPDQTVATKWRLEVAPAPTETLADALYLTYRRVLPTLVNANDVAALPYGFHDVLRWLVRAYVSSSENDQVGPDWQIVNNMIPALIAADVRAQGAIGSLCSTLDPDLSPGPCGLHFLPGTEIKMPGDP